MYINVQVSKISYLFTFNFLGKCNIKYYIQIVSIHMFYSFIWQLIVNGHNIVIGPNVQKHAEKVNEHLTEQ